MSLWCIRLAAIGGDAECRHTCTVVHMRHTLSTLWAPCTHMYVVDEDGTLATHCTLLQPLQDSIQQCTQEQTHARQVGMGRHANTTPLNTRTHAHMHACMNAQTLLLTWTTQMQAGMNVLYVLFTTPENHEHTIAYWSWCPSHRVYPEWFSSCSPPEGPMWQDSPFPTRTANRR